jgi:hypothetical protein
MIYSTWIEVPIYQHPNEEGNKNVLDTKNTIKSEGGGRREVDRR